MFGDVVEEGSATEAEELANLGCGLIGDLVEDSALLNHQIKRLHCRMHTDIVYMHKKKGRYE